MVSAKYLYGFVNCGQEQRLFSVGLVGETVRLVPYRNVAAVVSESPREVWEAHPHLVRAHGRVLAELLQTFAVLPARFGTVVPGKRVLALMEAHYSALVSGLAEVAGKVEWGIRALWPADKMEKTLFAGRQSACPNSGMDSGSAGRRYLERRAEEVRLDESLRKDAEKIIEEIHGSLGHLAEAAVLKKMETRKMLLSAAYLVAKERLEAFRTELCAVQDDLPGVNIISTGPWPPYNFVSLELDGRYG